MRSGSGEDVIVQGWPRIPAEASRSPRRGRVVTKSGMDIRMPASKRANATQGAFALVVDQASRRAAGSTLLGKVSVHVEANSSC